MSEQNIIERIENLEELMQNQFAGFYRTEENDNNGYSTGSLIKKYVSTSRAGVSTFVFKRQLENNEKLLLTFKNLTERAEFKYMLSNENLTTSSEIVEQCNLNGNDVHNNLSIKNTSNKNFLYISFRVGMGQESANVEDIRLIKNKTKEK